MAASWFETDRLQQERGKTGLEWVYARTVNSIFRPSAKCIIRDSRRHLERDLAKLKQQEQPALKNFENERKKCQGLVLENKNPAAIAKKVKYCHILKNRHLHILDGINTLSQAQNQLTEIETSIGEQGAAIDLTAAVQNVNRGYNTNRGKRVGLHYSMEKDLLLVQSEEIQDSWDQESTMTPEGNARMIDSFINENMLTRPRAEPCYRQPSSALDNVFPKTSSLPPLSTKHKEAECPQGTQAPPYVPNTTTPVTPEQQEDVRLKQWWTEINHKK